jgi:hypothetical protein
VRPWLLVSALLLIVPAAAPGQTVEVTPVGRLPIRGGFSAAGIEPADPAVDFEVKDAASFGAHLGFRVAEDGECIVRTKGSDISQVDFRAGLVLRF